MRLPGCISSKEFACNAGKAGWIPESGRPSRERSGNPLQYACLGNPMADYSPHECMHAKSLQSSPTLRELWIVARQTLLFIGSGGKNTGEACHFLLHGIFPTQESNLCLLRLPALAGRFFTTSITWKAQGL